MNETRGSLLVPGIWLVGLGTVFLVQQASGWPWVQAWPLFVIMGGVCGALSALVGRRWNRRGIWGVWGPLAGVVVGVLLLATTTGFMGLTPEQLARWWPLAIIGVGIWFLVGAVIARDSHPETETLDIPLDGISQAELRLGFGGGELRIGPAPAGTLVSGTFEGGVMRRDHGPGRIELQPYDPGSVFWAVRTLTWNVGITTEIPVDLRLDTGANRSRIDLTGLRIRRLELHTGASESHVRLPAAGATSVRAEAGMAALTLQVPEGVSARISSKVALGTTKVDETRFPRSFDGWASPDWETAANRVEIELQGGLGTIRVE